MRKVNSALLRGERPTQIRAPPPSANSSALRGFSRDAREAQDAELVAAAQLAAYHSKARSSEKVAVDYTERKHVRRRPGAAPGLVWYENARTIVVAPKDGAGS